MNLRLEYKSFQDFANRLWPCLSEEGMWVPSDSPAAVGELVDFDVMLADGFRLFRGTGQVISHGSGPATGPSGQGMMIRFGQLDETSKNLVRKVVSKHISEGGERFAPSSPAPKVSVVDSAGDEWPSVRDEPRSEAAGPDDAVEEPTEPDVESTAAIEMDAAADLATSADSEESDSEEQLTLPPDLELSPPFPEAEAEDEWSDAHEPELTSFLQPGSGELDLPEDLAPEALQTIDLGGRLAAEDGGESEGARTAAEAASTFSNLRAEFEGNLETGEGEGGSAGIDSDLPPTGSPSGPMASTVMPPVEPLADQDSLPSGLDDLPPDSYPVKSRRPSWLPWLLVSVLGLAAGVFLVAQLGSGGSGWLGGGGELAQGAVDPMSTESEGEDEATGADFAEPSPATFDVVASVGGADDEASIAELAEPAESAEATASTVPQSEPTAAAAPPPAPAEARVEVPTAAPGPALETPASEPGRTPGSARDGESSEPQVTAPETATPSGTTRLQRITWRPEGDETVVTLRFDRSLTSEDVQSLAVEGGSPRHVVKITGITGSVPKVVAIGSGHVLQLRLGKHDESVGPRLHVVADLVDSAVSLVAPVEFAGEVLRLRFGTP